MTISEIKDEMSCQPSRIFLNFQIFVIFSIVVNKLVLSEAIMFYPCSFFFHATLRGLRMERNRTSPHVRKWAGFEGDRPKFEGFSPERGRFTTSRLSADIFRMKRAIDKWNEILNYECPVQLHSPKFGAFGPQTAKIHCSFSHLCIFRMACKLSDSNCPRCCMSAVCLFHLTANVML